MNGETTHTAENNRFSDKVNGVTTHIANMTASIPDPNSTWIRPLEEEGIETHPGPRYIARNVNGLASTDRFQQCMQSVNTEHRKDAVSAVFIQEHNIKPSMATYTRLHARRLYRVLWLA